MRTSTEQRLRNRAIRSQLRAVIKELHSETSKEGAAKKLREVTSILDRIAGKGLIHKKNAARNKARLARLVNRLS